MVNVRVLVKTGLVVILKPDAKILSRVKMSPKHKRKWYDFQWSPPTVCMSHHSQRQDPKDKVYTLGTLPTPF